MERINDLSKNFKRIFLIVTIIACLWSFFGCLGRHLVPGERLLFEAKDYDGAIAEFTKVIESRQKYVEAAYYGRGMAYAQKGDYDRAIEDFNEAIKISPYFMFPYHGRGYAYSRKGDHDRAIRDYTKALDLCRDFIISPGADQRIRTFCIEAIVDRGNVCREKGDYDRAAADYNWAIRVRPRLSKAYFSRGMLWFLKADYDRAIQDYNKAIELNSKYAEAYDGRGLVYFKRGDYDKAISDYTRAIAIDPECAEAYDHRGDVWAKKGDGDRAAADHNRAKDIVARQMGRRDDSVSGSTTLVGRQIGRKETLEKKGEIVVDARQDNRRQEISQGGKAALGSYVVGRVYLKLEGLQGHYREIIGPAQVELVYIIGNKEKKILTTETDSHGYFHIAGQPSEGFYRVNKIKVSVIDKPIRSIVPEPDTSKGVAGMIYIMFSSYREAGIPIIDIGETVIFIKEEGKGAVERRYKGTKSILDPTHEKPFRSVEGNYGYPGLEYFASSGSGTLREIARQALEDRRQFVKAEPLKKEADKLKEKDRGAAIVKYREAIGIYSAYADAYAALIDLLCDLNKPRELLKVAEEGAKNCPWSSAVYGKLGKAYTTLAQADKVIPLLERFVEENPANLQGYVNLSNAHCDAGQFEKGELVWQRGLEHIQDDSKYEGVGIFYEKAGKLDQAVEYYKKNLIAKPNDDRSRFFLARAYIKAEREKEVSDLISRNSKALIYYQCNWAYFERRQYDKAAEMVMKALELYEDGSIKEERGTVEKRLAMIQNQKKLEGIWRQYLNQIQKDGDYDNWNGKPYDLYLKRYPIPTK